MSFITLHRTSTWIGGLRRPTRIALTIPILTLGIALAAEFTTDIETKVMLVLATMLPILIGAYTLARTAIGETPALSERILQGGLVFGPFVACGLHFGLIGPGMLLTGVIGFGAFIAFVICLHSILRLRAVSVIGALATLIGCVTTLATLWDAATGVIGLTPGIEISGATLALFGTMLFLHDAFQPVQH